MRKVLLASASVVAALATPAIAQNGVRPDIQGEVKPTAHTATPEVDGQVSDIVVTAQRIAQPLQRVPISVQPVTGKELESRKLNDIAELQTAVPSLAIGLTNSISLRGVGSLTYSPNVDSSVGITIDDVSLGVPIFMNYFSFEDVERVEVLNGPQGLLFGRNASAGLVNVVTNRPEIAGSVSGSLYGESDYRDATPGGGWGEIVRGTVNVPVGSNAALRVSGIYSQQDPIAAVVARGPRADFGNYQRRAGAKAKFLFEPNDRISIYLIGDYALNRGIGGIYENTLRSVGTGSLTGVFANRDGITPGPDNLKLGYGAPYDGLRLDTGGASANMAYTLSDAIKVSNIFAWRAFKTMAVGDLDGTSFDGIDANVRRSRYRQFSDELRVALDAGSLLDGQAGVYYFNSVLHTDNSVGAAVFGALDPLFASSIGPADSVTNPYLGSDLHSQIRNSSIAGFGQFNLHPVDRLTVILGGRVTHDNNSTTLVQNQRFYPVPLGAPNYAAADRVRNTNFSWKMGGQYDQPGIGMAYITYSKGYKGPAFNESAAVPGQSLSIGPETVHALELGVKTELLDHKLRLNVAAFREIFDDFQVQGYDARTTSFFTSNAAKVRSQGIELFAEARPVRPLTFTVAATILDSEFRHFSTDRCYPGQPTCSAQGTSDSSGNRTPSSARFTSTLGATYEHSLTADATWSLSGSWYHRSPVNFSSNGNPETRLGTIDTFDSSLRLTIDKRFHVAIFCKNCTNKRFPVYIGSDIVDATLLNVNSTIQTWGYNSIRTIGISTSIQF